MDSKSLVPRLEQCSCTCSMAQAGLLDAKTGAVQQLHTLDDANLLSCLCSASAVPPCYVRRWLGACAAHSGCQVTVRRNKTAPVPVACAARTVTAGPVVAPAERCSCSDCCCPPGLRDPGPDP
eukprot:353408-Chlamydomonas_euryale.AAC.2